MNRRCHPILFLLSAAILGAATLGAQTIVQSRGADARVDYSSLERFGPWDDRNYELTLEDLALLGPNEEEQSEAIPAFYRVYLRRTMDLPRTGPAQYPRSALPRFLNRYGGFLIDGKVYTEIRRAGDRFVIELEGGVEPQDLIASKALDGEARVTNPSGAAESAIAFNPVNTNFVIAGTNGPGGGQKMHFSSDGGATWTQAAALPLGGTCCDPTVVWSSDGSKAYTATLGSNVFVYRSADNGQTWSDLATEPGNDPRRELGSGVDKEYLHVDLSPTSPHKDNVYLTWHQGNSMKFSRSTDFAHTWSAVQTLSDGTTLGIGSDITTDSAGNVYYVWPVFGSQKIVVRKSSDGGLSFAPTVDIASTQGSFDFPIPSMESRNVFIYVAADTDRSGGAFDGSIYAAWTDTTAPETGNPSTNHARIQVAYSRDGGATWTTTTPHETADAATVDRWHQWMSVGPDGKVYVAFYDTRRDPTRTSVDFFYSVSADGAQTWSTPERLTSVQSPNINDGFEFGDYNGMDVAMGDLITIFTDNRAEGGGNSVDVYAAGLAVGTGGLFIDGFESGDTSGWSSTVN